MKRRLFLLAGYNAHGLIDESLIFYIQALAACGDVVLCMDSDCSAAELQRVAPYVLHATAQRHGEYDFGSYKRAYMYAADADILRNYEFVYMVNDSVYGPLMNLEPSLTRMEKLNRDAFGLVYNPTASRPHIQSWFIGMRKNVFLSPWYDEFMRAITHQPDKGSITYLYEQGFTEMLRAHHVKFACLYNCPGRSVYNNVAALFRRGMPFMKKVAFSRADGALGNRILYILRHVSPDVRDMILASAHRTWGDEYIKWLLTRNPIKITYCHIKHALRKIFIEGL
ncbi:MAG: rhamnan synthesis F family protein [Pseudomonadota bacterium]|nr:rhamnan synthesis F family protein [Pseudomonadota bacterium]